MEFTLTAPGPETPADAPLHQSPVYGQAMARLGAQVRVLCIHEGGTCLAQAQIFSRRVMGLPLHWLPRGPVWAGDVPATQHSPLLAQLPQAKGLRGIWLATPDDMKATAAYTRLGYRALLTPQHVAELSLHRDPAIMRARMHGKWRNRLRRAEDAGLHVTHRPFDPGRDAPLLDLERTQRKHRRYTDLQPSFVSYWSQTAPKATRLFQLRDGKRPLAVMIFLLHGWRATYQIGWRDLRNAPPSAHHLLLWQAAEYLASKGFRQLDLGTIDTETAPGLAHFKLGSGGRARPLGPSLLRLPCARIPLAIRRAAV
ncbi:GNAT family N-acetyltransferase [Roseovarius sp. MMSF_3281]|uniref:GNAT family N-acetyltransferase n=1 Tax=Roseovarius sp. MMSF_3281 TaxID=3046694 RepID=UPI00273E82E7|nr:GNAT family N-acetyltransferase [Roseovarius sp. MMSF_3281]